MADTSAPSTQDAAGMIQHHLGMETGCDRIQEAGGDDNF